MKIGELSARTGATERMLRYYEQQGLLAPQRTSSKYRSYAEADVERVRYIRCMLASALPTHLIAEALNFLLDDPVSVPPPGAERQRVVDVLQAELAALTERIAVLDSSRRQLARLVNDIRNEVVGPLQPVPPDALPPSEWPHERVPSAAAPPGRKRNLDV